MRSLTTAVALIGFLCACVWSAAETTRRGFEVAAIRPHDRTSYSQPTQVSPTHARYIGHSLASLVLEAYSLRSHQVKKPAWLRDQVYDVVATLPPDSDVSQVPAMLQLLLAERFHLRVHWESARRAAYALIPSQSGAKLKVAAEGKTKRVVVDISGGRVTARATTVAELSDTLTGCCSDRPVIDKTGIAGRFDVDLGPGLEMLTFRGLPSAPGRQSEAGAHKSDPELPLSVAMRGLGLHLVPIQVEDRLLVVDSIDKTPTPN